MRFFCQICISFSITTINTITFFPHIRKRKCSAMISSEVFQVILIKIVESDGEIGLLTEKLITAQ